MAIKRSDVRETHIGSSSVTLVHIPTGVSITVNAAIHRYTNSQAAWRLLESRLASWSEFTTAKVR